MKISKIGYGAMIVLYFGVLGYAAKKLHDECKTTYKQDFKIPSTDENVNDYYKLDSYICSKIDKLSHKVTTVEDDCYHIHVESTSKKAIDDIHKFYGKLIEGKIKK